ncbi:MAG: ATP-grasp domain-containing protein, partial [Chloroflexota bacterium]
MTRIGIFGGGQLAKMTALAAANMNIETLIFANSNVEPALSVTPHKIIGAWDDEALLKQFAESVDVVTLESEFVPVDLLRKVESYGTPVFASPDTVEQVRDKLIQKRRMQSAGIDVPRFKQVLVGSDILEASTEYGFPVMLKARTNGYDGYGNVLIRRAHDIEPALQKLDGRSLMIEEMVNFVRELAVIVARGADGSIRAYPVVETVQKNNVCHTVLCPANTEESVAKLATDMAVQAVEAIDGVGVFGVEMFEIANNQVLFNEIAPRPHNSGHY